MSLMTDCRPTNFGEIVGHDSQKKMLESKLSKKGHIRCYLISGNPGLGKTTFARVIANFVDAKIIEFDAGNLTGVDDVRQLIKDASTVNITSGKTNKCYIIDECHMLSNSSWNSLLKTIEEPPKFTYFIFCTTELNKVPKAINSQRCISIKLNSLNYDEIYEILENANTQDIEVGEKHLSAIAQNSDGSPRKALNMLETAVEIKDYEEFKKILVDTCLHDEIEANVLEMAKELCKEKPLINKLVVNLKNVKNYEGARIQIFNYLATVCLNRPALIERLVCFSDPIKSNTTGKGELLIQLHMAKNS